VPDRESESVRQLGDRQLTISRRCTFRGQPTLETYIALLPITENGCPPGSIVYPFSVGSLASLDMSFRKNVNRLDCDHILK
jgi:hypothetical protein